jgi:serine/threonine protein kinase
MIGALLNQRYRLDSELGQGGMGTVYRGYDLLLEREVAVKLLSKTNLGTEGRSRLLNEARAVARLNHPNIVNLHDAGEADVPSDDGISLVKTPYIVMELVEGTNLHDQPPKSMPMASSIATSSRKTLSLPQMAGRG